MGRRSGEFAALLVAVASAGTALGQGTLLGSDQQAYADAYWRLGANYQRNLGDTHDTTSFDSFYAVEDRTHQFQKFRGRGFAEHGATYTPTTPGFLGQFSSVVMDACTSAQIFTPDTNNSEDRATGLAQGIIDFRIDAPQDWTWIGAWQGATSSTTGSAFYRVRGHISLVDSFTGAQIVFEDRVSLMGSGDWAEPIGFSGTLFPGSYRLTWMHESIVANGDTPWGHYGVSVGGGPLISCVNSTFTLVPGPSVLGVVFGGLVLAARRRR